MMHHRYKSMHHACIIMHAYAYIYIMCAYVCIMNLYVWVYCEWQNKISIYIYIYMYNSAFGFVSISGWTIFVCWPVEGDLAMIAPDRQIARSLYADLEAIRFWSIWRLWSDLEIPPLPSPSPPPHFLNVFVSLISFFLFYFCFIKARALPQALFFCC